MDRFTRRIHQHYEIAFIQSNVAHEDLASAFQDKGKVTTFYGKLFTTPEAVSTDEMLDILAEKLDGVVTRDFRVDKVQVALITSAFMVLTLTTDHGGPLLGTMYASMAKSSLWTPQSLIAIFANMGYTVGYEEHDDSQAPISFAMPSSNGVNIIDKKFDELTLESISENYLPEVITQARAMIEAMTTASNGILILNGPPGTGKSYLIRAMLWELKGIRHPIVCTPPQQFLTEMGLLTDAIMSADDDYPPSMRHDKKAGSLIVLEDVGELLMEDNVTHHVNETANLLNFADGLLSLLANTLFILTFNHEIDRINPALTRPGRCLGQLTVGNLGFEQAGKLVGWPVPASQEYSLAEVYAMKRTGAPPKTHTKRKLGFGGV